MNDVRHTQLTLVEERAIHAIGTMLGWSRSQIAEEICVLNLQASLVRQNLLALMRSA